VRARIRCTATAASGGNLSTLQLHRVDLLDQGLCWSVPLSVCGCLLSSEFTGKAGVWYESRCAWSWSPWMWRMRYRANSGHVHCRSSGLQSDFASNTADTVASIGAVLDCSRFVDDEGTHLPCRCSIMRPSVGTANDDIVILVTYASATGANIERT